jgi:hypothetical protein
MIKIATANKTVGYRQPEKSGRAGHDGTPLGFINDLYYNSMLTINSTIQCNTTTPEGVILLHGLCRSSASMTKMESYLRQDGYVVLNCDYPSRTDSIENLSNKVINEALSSIKLKSCTVIHFVTHSLGGILVRSYFSRKTDSRLGRVVMLGPPNKGSEVVDRIGMWHVLKFLNGPAGNELGTHNQSVPNQLGRVSFELGVIAGDRSINWINSLMIHGPDDGKVSVERTKVEGMKEHIVVHTAHPFMMKNKKVLRCTLSFLRSGTFNITENP